MKNVQFNVPGTPVPKGRARFARHGKNVVAYTPDETARYENLARLCAAAAMTQSEPFVAPILLHVQIYLPIPASWSKKRQGLAADGMIAATKKPDADNVLKALKDGMNGVVYRDDSQVIEMSVLKRYGVSPHVSIAVVCSEAEPA